MLASLNMASSLSNLHTLKMATKGVRALRGYFGPL